MKEKFKLIIENDRLFYGILIILLSITSFGLGRASAIDHNQNTKIGTNEPKIQLIEPITLPANTIISKSPAVSSQPSNPIQNISPDSNLQFVASKNGTKYHLSTCGGAKNIKPENKLFFNSREEAEAAGYTKATNCPGL